MSGLFRNIQEKAACEPREEGSRGQGGLWLEVLAWWSAAVRLGWDGDESQGRMNPPGTPALEGSSRVPRAKPEGMGKEGAAKEGVGDAGSWKSPWQETHPRRQHRRHREASSRWVTGSIPPLGAAASDSHLTYFSNYFYPDCSSWQVCKWQCDFVCCLQFPPLRVSRRWPC